MLRLRLGMKLTQEKKLYVPGIAISVIWKNVKSIMLSGEKIIDYAGTITLVYVGLELKKMVFLKFLIRSLKHWVKNPVSIAALRTALP
jgi:hypothetical protein